MKTMLTNQLRLARPGQIGLLFTLYAFAYMAGRFGALMGNADWWVAKGSFVAASTILILLVLNISKQDPHPTEDQK